MLTALVPSGVQTSSWRCVCSGIDIDEAPSVSAASSVRTTMTSSQTKQLSASSLIGVRCRLIDWSCNSFTPAPSSRTRPSPLIRFSPLGRPGWAAPPLVRLRGRGREMEHWRSISTLLWQFEMRGRPASVTVPASSRCARIRVSTLIAHVKSHWGRLSDTPLPAPASHGALFHGRLAWLKVIGGLRLWWTDMPNNFHYVAVTLSRSLINFSASDHMLCAVDWRATSVWYPCICWEPQFNPAWPKVGEDPLLIHRFDWAHGSREGKSQCYGRKDLLVRKNMTGLCKTH